MIPIVSQLSMSGTKPSIDGRFGPYNSIQDAYDTLSTEYQIISGLPFGIKENNNDISVYQWTKTNGTITDCRRVSHLQVVTFNGIVEGDVTVSDVTGTLEKSYVEIVFLSSIGKFGYLDGSSYIIDWLNSYLWQSTTPHNDVLYLNLSNNSLYYYNGTTLTSLSGGSSVNVTGMAVFTNVAAMAAATGLSAGDVVMTAGFYNAKDGGAAFYRIVENPSNISSYPADGMQRIALATSGLYADILVLNGEVNIMQLGAIPVKMMYNMASQTQEYGGSNYRDCHDNIMSYITLCKRTGIIYELVFPSGHFFTSPCFLVLGNDVGVRIRGASPRQYGSKNCTTIHAWTAGQEYIWTVSGAEHLLHKDYTFYGAGGVHITNIQFCGLHGSGQRVSDTFSPIVALIAVGLADSYFDNLSFMGVKGCGMLLNKVQETYFGFLSFQTVGAFYKNFAMPCIWFAKLTGTDGFVKNILGRTTDDYFVGTWDSSTNKYTDGYGASGRNCSADYFGYINAEGLAGSIIHADLGAVWTHSEIGNIQWEGTLYAYTNSAIGGYTSKVSELGNSAAANYSDYDTDTYPNDVTILTGAVTGYYMHDILIHAITQTWGQNGYIVLNADTSSIYRVRQVGAVVVPSGSNPDYINVHLSDFIARPNANNGTTLPVCYFQNGTVDNPDGFSLGCPLPQNTDLIRIFGGSTTPKIKFSGQLPQDMIYPALCSNYHCVYYDADALAPGHLIGRNNTSNGSFSFNYDTTKKYIARVKQTGNVNYDSSTKRVQCCFRATYTSGGTSYTENNWLVSKRYNQFFQTPLTFNHTPDDGTKVTVQLGYGLAYDQIAVISNAPSFNTAAPTGVRVWPGRLWYDTTNSKLMKCTARKLPGVYSITCVVSDSTKTTGSVVINIEDTNLTITFDSSDWISGTDVLLPSDSNLAALLKKKLLALNYAAYSNSSSNIVYIAGKEYNSYSAPYVYTDETTDPAIVNETGFTFTGSVIKAGTSSDTWEETSL